MTSFKPGTIFAIAILFFIAFGLWRPRSWGVALGILLLALICIEDIAQLFSNQGLGQITNYGFDLLISCLILYILWRGKSTFRPILSEPPYPIHNSTRSNGYLPIHTQENIVVSKPLPVQCQTHNKNTTRSHPTIPSGVALISGFIAGSIEACCSFVLFVVIMLVFPCSDLLTHDDVSALGFVSGGLTLILFFITGLVGYFVANFPAKIREGMGKDNLIRPGAIVPGIVTGLVLFDITLSIFLLNYNFICAQKTGS